MNTDVLIIGAGISGLVCAIGLSRKRPDLTITILDKSTGESNTLFAQGGIAAVGDWRTDSISSHVADTVIAGNFEGDSEAIQKIIAAAPEGIKFLKSCGVVMDSEPDGTPKLGLEGGHSHSRIWHHRDQTGRELVIKLRIELNNHPNIHLLSNHFATDLLVNQNASCEGATVIDWTRLHLFEIRSSAVVLCTGGSGQLFARTTNPEIATADGLGMAIRAGVKIENLASYQFHPTVLFKPTNKRALLLTEALRGAGAYVVNDEGDRFLFKGHSDGELAPRDVVSKLIWAEMEKSGKHHVYLDARHLSPLVLKEDFPGVLDSCAKFGLNPHCELLPITPAAHYQCGGISVDLKGKTNLENLYALGECAYTGMHGSNRLASNSLLEGLVCALWNADSLAGSLSLGLKTIPAYKHITFSDKSQQSSYPILAELQNFMTSLYRNDSIDSNKDKFSFWKEVLNDHIQKELMSPEVLETRNLVYAGEELFKQFLRKRQYA